MAEPTPDRVRARWWQSLERWSATVFLVAGGVWFVLLALAVYEAHFRHANGAVLSMTDLLLLLATAAALVALLGFYPQVSAQAPRLTDACAVLLVIGVGSFLIYTFGILLGVFTNRARELSYLYWRSIVESIDTGGSTGSTTTVADFFWIVVLLAILLGFLVFGIVSLRSRIPSRSVGVLMLLPAAAVLVHALAGAVIDMPDPVLAEWAVISVVLLAVGYRLRAERAPTDPSKPTPTEVRHD